MQNNLNPKVTGGIDEDILKDFIKTFNTPAGKRVLDYLEERANVGYPDVTNINNNYYLAGHLGNIKHCRNLTNFAVKKTDKKRSK